MKHDLFPHRSFQDRTAEESSLQLEDATFTRSKSENLTFPGKSLTIDTSLIIDQRSPVSPAVKALDLSSSGTENSFSYFSSEKDQMRQFEHQCSEVSPALFMSGDSVAKSYETLAHHGITHVVNCVGFTCGEYHRESGIKYLTLYLEDSPNQDVVRVLYYVFDFIEAAHLEQGRVLIHCTQGISRSAALCIAYIMYNRKVPYEEAFKGVKAIRGVTNPNIGFTCQLLLWQKQLVPATRVRAMYNVCPLSRMESKKMLVLKSLKAKTVKLLDPRGVFVVEGEHKIFIWLGGSSAKEHRAGSQDLVAKLFKYEMGHDLPIEEIPQGEETQEFLVELGVTRHFSSLRRIPELEVYDKDYSLLYQDRSGKLF